jgi:hypothetical protein
VVRRPKGGFEAQPVVVVRPTVVIDAAHVPAAPPRPYELPLRAAKLRRLLEEPLTRPLGSMQAGVAIVRVLASCDDELPTQPRARSPLPQDTDVDTRPARVRAKPAPTYAPAQAVRDATHEPYQAAAACVIERVDSAAAARDLAAQPALRHTPGSGRRQAHRLIAPDAPPRSAAIAAGILDGWPQVPRSHAGAPASSGQRQAADSPARNTARPATSARPPHTPAARGASDVGAQALWLCAAALAVCTMLLTYVFTSSLLWQGDPARAQLASLQRAAPVDVPLREQVPPVAVSQATGGIVCRVP